MVNTRQIIGQASGQIDDAMKTFITETISIALALSIENVTRSIQEQMSVNGVCLRQDFLASELQRLIGETNTYTTPNRTVYRCNQFFKVDDIVEGDKEVYVEALLKRFSSTYKDPMSELKNIRQRGRLVQLYIDAFDLIMTKVEVLEAQAVSFFLGGLNKEIEMIVRMFKPQSLADAYCLSKLQEANNNVSRKINKSLMPTPKPVYNNFVRNTGSQMKNVNYTPNRPKPMYNNAPYRKHLTQKELDKKRAKNQCKNEAQYGEGVFGYEDSAEENRTSQSRQKDKSESVS
ncbi:copia protein [Tanacetum coccineum]